jgi:sugar O-acyltransferase (sialic acid O-acetyltransferase NeuD family)
VPIVILGAGGLGRECLDTALACGWEVEAFVDEHKAGSSVRGLPVLAACDLPAQSSYVIGIADATVRRRLAGEMSTLGHRPRVLVHPAAVVAPETALGEGSIVLGGAYVSSSVTVGRHGQVHYNATVGHDAVLGDFVSVFPGGNVSGSVRLDDGVTVGSAAVVLQGRHVGEGGFVGAGAVVTRDVEEGSVVAGNPARRLS